MVYHQGLTGEVMMDGTYEVPPEERDLWTRCQEIKSQRRNTTSGRPRGPNRHFPFPACSHATGVVIPTTGKRSLRVNRLTFVYLTIGDDPTGTVTPSPVPSRYRLW